MTHYRQSSTMFSSRQQRMWRRNQNTTRFATTAALGPISHTVIIALMIAVLGLLYLTQVTKTSFYGYEINQRNKNLGAMIDERRDLEVENARLTALDRVSNSSVATSLGEPSSVEYARN